VSFVVKGLFDVLVGDRSGVTIAIKNPSRHVGKRGAFG
jgi:hypothetical protein